MDLGKVQPLLLQDMRSSMASLLARAPIAEKAESLRDISRLMQAIAICKLIHEADVVAYRQYLIRGGQARRYYLRKSREENNVDDRFLGLSRVESIFDTLAAGDVQLFRDIAALSIDRWHRGWEYEDDFCYYLFVQRVVATPGFLQSPEAGALLAQFRKAIEDQPSPRLALCQALHDRSLDDFRAALEKLLQLHADYYEAKRPTITEYSAQAIFWPRSFVCIEALAWLFVGNRLGLPLADQFQFCPELARPDFAPIVVEDLFESLDQVLKNP